MTSTTTFTNNCGYTLLHIEAYSHFIRTYVYVRICICTYVRVHTCMFVWSLALSLSLSLSLCVSLSLCLTVSPLLVSTAQLRAHLETFTGVPCNNHSSGLLSDECRFLAMDLCRRIERSARVCSSAALPLPESSEAWVSEYTPLSFPFFFSTPLLSFPHLRSVLWAVLWAVVAVMCAVGCVVGCDVGCDVCCGLGCDVCCCGLGCGL